MFWLVKGKIKNCLAKAVFSNAKPTSVRRFAIFPLNKADQDKVWTLVWYNLASFDGEK
jgi:hypothetical protein